MPNTNRPDESTASAAGGRKLSISVHVMDENGRTTVYQKGDTPTREHAKLITNPDVWAEEG